MALSLLCTWCIPAGTIEPGIIPPPPMDPIDPIDPTPSGLRPGHPSSPSRRRRFPVDDDGWPPIPLCTPGMAIMPFGPGVI